MLFRSIKHMPHIYSVYGKWDYTPVPEFSLTTNLLFAYDGTSFKYTEQSENYETDDPFNPEKFSLYPPYTAINQWILDDFQGLVSTQCSWMLSNSFLLHGQFSYTAHAEIQNNHLYELNRIGGYYPVYDVIRGFRWRRTNGYSG